MGLKEYGKFVFKQEDHALGKKTVLGKTYGANVVPFPLPPCHGLSEGDELIDDLVARDETAEHIAARMIEWFVMDSPPDALIQRVAGAFSNSGGEIKPMIQELFDPAYLNEIHPSGNLKIRRPINFVTAAIRATNPTVDMEPLCTTGPMPVCQVGSSVISMVGWISSLFKMGQLSGLRASPDGFPGRNITWAGGLHPRLEFATALAFNDGGLGLTIDTAGLDQIFGAMTATNDLTEVASASIFLGKLCNVDVRRVQKYINTLATSLSYDDLRRECLATILSAPSYQYLH